jgi:gamma-glutamylcyclotransferase (GGCT)/AIG2-like uncharacterized protein YtfP
MICIAIFDDLISTGKYGDFLKPYRKETVDAMITHHKMYSVGGTYPVVVGGATDDDRIRVELTVLDNPKEILPKLHKKMMHKPDSEDSITEFVKIGSTKIKEKKRAVYIYRWRRNVKIHKYLSEGDWSKYAK